MALSTAERQRRFRARKKELREAQPDLSRLYVQGSFAEFWKREAVGNGDWQTLEEAFATAGLDLPSFENEDDPQFYEFDLERAGLDHAGALGRAERVIGAFEDGLRVMAGMVGRYKIQETEREIAEIESETWTSPSERDRRLDRLDQLTKIRSRLEKQYRLSFPVFEVKD